MLEANGALFSPYRLASKMLIFPGENSAQKRVFDQLKELNSVSGQAPAIDLQSASREVK